MWINCWIREFSPMITDLRPSTTVPSVGRNLFLNLSPRNTRNTRKDGCWMAIKYQKLLFMILRGLSDNNISFNDLRNLLLNLGFEERIKGSHHNFRNSGVIEKINLQKDNGKAKGYQVRQVGNVILRYKLGGNL